MRGRSDPARGLFGSSAALLPEAHPCGRCPVRPFTFCGALSAESLARLKALGSTVRMRRGQCLFLEGDPAGLVFNLTRGSLKLYRSLPDGRRHIAGFLSAGEFLAPVVQAEHAFTAEAVEPAELCRFPRERFEDFLGDHPEMEHALYLITAQELAAAREQMVLLGRKTAAERVASFLLDRFDRMRSRDADWEIARLPMTRTDIADHLGLTKETVSRAFTRLRHEGVIALLPAERVELLRRDRLERLAAGEG